MALCWTRNIPGGAPWSVLFGEEHIGCGYVTDPSGHGPMAPHTLACLDLQGRDCWSASNIRLELVLPGERFLGFRGESLEVLDSRGRPSRGIVDGRTPIPCDSAFQFMLTPDRLCIKTRSPEMLITDRTLNLVDRMPLPRNGSGVFIGDGIAYLEADQIMRIDRTGHAEALCPLPLAAVHAAMDRWEQETGRPALDGVVTATIPSSVDLATEIPAVMRDRSRQTVSGMGDRPRHYDWELEFVEATGALFLYNFADPHLLACIDLDGHVRWCTYINSSCCGGPPVSLPNGRLVVSSGCGGILTWLDAQGNILGRSSRHEGRGLAPAYSPYVCSLADSGCTIDGGMGIVAYGASGELRWKYDCNSSRYDYSEPHDLLVTASRAPSDHKSESVSISCVKNLGSARPRAS